MAHMATDTVSHRKIGRVERLEVVGDDHPMLGVHPEAFVRLHDDDPRAQSTGTRYHQDRVEAATAGPGERRNARRPD